MDIMGNVKRIGEEVTKQSNTNTDSKRQRAKAIMRTLYQFRYNTIKCKPEFRAVDGSTVWKPIDKVTINNFVDMLDEKHFLDARADLVKSILESTTFSKRTNPVQEYFKTLPAYNGKENIRQFCTTVRTHTDEIFIQYFTKWLTAVVANVMVTHRCANHTCLVLTGEQGKFKSTWLETLCPKELRAYMYTGKIDPNNKDALTYMAECFLINIDDQLRQLNKKEENDLKSLITNNVITYRRPYDPYPQDYPKLASFMGSVNGNDFLTDPTGSRRFLPFEALEIDIDRAQKLDMSQIYAEAFHLYNTGFRYWFTDEEMSQQRKHNLSFQVVTDEEQLLLDMYDAPAKKEDATHHLPPAVIKSKLETNYHARLSTKRLGEALTRRGFIKWRKSLDGKATPVWAVIEKDYLKKDRESKSPV